jgi:hypothetical protein
VQGFVWKVAADFRGQFPDALPNAIAGDEHTNGFVRMAGWRRYSMVF